MCNWYVVLITVFVFEDFPTNLAFISWCFKMHGLYMSLAIALDGKILSTQQTSPSNFAIFRYSFYKDVIYITWNKTDNFIFLKFHSIFQNYSALKKYMQFQIFRRHEFEKHTWLYSSILIIYEICSNEPLSFLLFWKAFHTNYTQAQDDQCDEPPHV